MTSVTVKNGIQAWWVIPQAVHRNGKTLISGIRNAGNVWVGEIRKGLPAIRTYIFSTNPNDHIVPAISAPPSPHPVVAVFALHRSETVLRFRVFGESRSDPLMRNEVTKTFSGNVTYAQTYYNPSNPTQRWVLCRVDQEQWHITEFAVSLDGSVTFGDSVAIVDAGGTEQIYITSAEITLPNGNHGVRIALSGNPVSSTIRRIYAGYIDFESGNLYKTDGTTILGNLDGAGLPTAPDDWDVVFDAPAGVAARLFEVSKSPNLFEVAYATWETENPAPTYYVSELNLTDQAPTWQAYSLGASGAIVGYLEGVQYVGGLSFSKTSPRTVYVTREAAGTWTIEKWVDESLSETLVTDTEKLFRAFAAPADSAYEVIYSRILAYTDKFTEYESDLVGLLK